MKKFLMLGTAGLLAASFALVPLSRADTLLIGQLSFDSGLSPDGNTFDLSNYTDGFIGGPDSIADDEYFSGTLTVTPVGGAAEVFTFSDIDALAGIGGVTLATFDPSVDITSAVLSLTLSNSSGVNFYDDNGDPAVADLAAVADLSLPLNDGSSLTPCDGSGNTCSNALLNVDTVVSTVTPEPGTWALALTGLGGLVVFEQAFAGRLRRR